MKKHIANIGFLIILLGMIFDYYFLDFQINDLPTEEKLAKIEMNIFISRIFLILGFVIVIIGYNIDLIISKLKSNR